MFLDILSALIMLPMAISAAVAESRVTSIIGNKGAFATASVRFFLFLVNFAA